MFRPRSGRFLLRVLIAILGIATLVLGYRACSNVSNIAVVKEHATFLCKTASAFQTLVLFNSKSELGTEEEKLGPSDEILIIQPGTQLRFLDYALLHTPGEPNSFAVQKVRVIDGPHAGVEGWVLSADVRSNLGPWP